MRALQANPDDPVARLYRDQSETMIARPPPPDWDGISVLAHK